MKIFLAGSENFMFKHCLHYFHPNSLFSYHYFNDIKPDFQKRVRDLYNKNNVELICDSGLFTYMFGSGKGQAFTYQWWEDYAKRYIDAAHSWGFNNITIVECDAHKLLGMDATFRLREVFAKSGLPVLYVWHVEETIDGLIELSNTVDYFALSVPELRGVFKGETHSYQSAVKNLLRTIHERAKRVPKIHLLGNTVMDLMEDTMPYSCDSTSWNSGMRYGKAQLYRDGHIAQCDSRSPAFIRARELMVQENGRALREARALFESEGKEMPMYVYDALVSAKAFATYQKYIDKRFPWKGVQIRG